MKRIAKVLMALLASVAMALPVAGIATPAVAADSYPAGVYVTIGGKRVDGFDPSAGAIKNPSTDYGEVYFSALYGKAKLNNVPRLRNSSKT